MQVCIAALLCLSTVQITHAKVGLISMPSFSEVKLAHQPSNAVLLDRHGRLMHSIRLDMQAQRAQWVELPHISPQLAYAVIAAEDKNFESHSGVDWSAMASATWDNSWGLLRSQRSRGASTLTMQLVGLLDENQVKAGRRSILDKVSQSALALRLEQTWTKSQILEAYLNLASFKGELVGVGALSHGLFGKAPRGLNAVESAVAAVLLRSPNAKSAVVSRRACNLLVTLKHPTDCGEVSAMVDSVFLRPPVDSSRWVASPQASPHLAYKLLGHVQKGSKESKGPFNKNQSLHSSVLLPLQTFAQQSLRQQLAQLTLQNVEDGAVLVLDNATGEVLAWVGSSGDLSQARDVDGITALRQAGSTLKPFLYALAFEKKYLTPASLIEDSPYTLDTGNGLYAPQNYEAVYKGWVSVRAALGNSLNIPAVKAVVQTGVEPFHQQLRQLGFSSLTQSADWYGYSLALGSADVSLLMLTNAYRAMANGGQWSPLKLTPVTPPENQSAAAKAHSPCVTAACSALTAGKPQRAMTEQASFMVGNILSDRSARALTFGLESWLSTPYWSSVKTGTSKDMRDNWCIGYSSRYTVGVWVGNASGSPMHDVSGITGAAPVWREVMDWLHRGNAQQGRAIVRSMQPKAPSGLIQQNIRFEPRLEPPRQEWFIRGSTNEPKSETNDKVQVIELVKRPVLTRIQYPAQGTVLALDADIPPNRQRIQFSAGGTIQKGWAWRLNGKALMSASIQQGWLPMPGRHRLELLSDKGVVVDEVQFTVRPLKAGRS